MERNDGFDAIFNSMIHQVEQDVRSKIKEMDVVGETNDKLFMKVNLENGREMRITIHAFKLHNGDLGLRFFGNYVS